MTSCDERSMSEGRCQTRCGCSAITRNEQFWIEVVRQASCDSDPPPRLEVVRKVRAIFRTYRRPC